MDRQDDEDVPFEDSEQRITRVDFSHQGFPVVTSCITTEKDFCMLEETDPDCAYINLQRNPETYTGFSGLPSQRIWNAIYEENCFVVDESNPIDAQCIEARSFHRVISGMHSSITAHLGARYHDSEKNIFVRRYINFASFSYLPCFAASTLMTRSFASGSRPSPSALRTSTFRMSSFCAP